MNKNCPSCFVLHRPTECPTLGRGKVARAVAGVPAAPSVAAPGTFGGGIKWSTSRDPVAMGDVERILGEVLKPRRQRPWQLPISAEIPAKSIAIAAVTQSMFFQAEKLVCIEQGGLNNDILKECLTTIEEFRIDGKKIDRMPPRPSEWHHAPQLGSGDGMCPLRASPAQEIGILIKNDTDAPIKWWGVLFGICKDG